MQGQSLRVAFMLATTRSNFIPFENETQPWLPCGINSFIHVCWLIWTFAFFAAVTTSKCRLNCRQNLQLQNHFGSNAHQLSHTEMQLSPILPLVMIGCFGGIISKQWCAGERYAFMCTFACELDRQRARHARKESCRVCLCEIGVSISSFCGLMRGTCRICSPSYSI